MPISKIKQSSLDASALTGANITDGTIAAADLATNAVTTAKISSGSVTNAKIAADAITTAKIADTVNLGRRNMIINGAMKVSQRGTSTTGVGATTGYFSADRWKHELSSTSGRLTSSQAAVTDLAGFRSALKFACTTADTSIAAGEYFVLTHKIEGLNIQGVGFGTASAKPLTLSFYAKANGNATYIAQLQTGGSNEISASFNVTSSWQRFEINYPAATSVGSVLTNDTSAQLNLQIWLVAGATYSGGSSLNTTWGSPNNNTMAVGVGNFFSSTSNEFFITGVQLEIGDTATPFEHLSFAEELAVCRRYFEVTAVDMEVFGSVGACYTSSAAYGSWNYQVEKRSNPSVGRWQGAAGDYRLRTNGNNATCTAMILSNATTYGCRWDATVSGGSVVSGHAAWLSKNNSPAQLYADSEL